MTLFDFFKKESFDQRKKEIVKRLTNQARFDWSELDNLSKDEFKELIKSAINDGLKNVDDLKQLCYVKNIYGWW